MIGDTVIADGCEYVVVQDFAVRPREPMTADRWAEAAQRRMTEMRTRYAEVPTGGRYRNPRGSPAHRGPRDA